MADSPLPGAIKVGDVIAARYEIRGMIGRGGMGRIYRVFDKVLGEEVALKTLLPDHTGDKVILDRFFNEAKIARSLSHPSIVRVHDIGRAGEVVYISMELLKGKSLRQMLDQVPPGQRLPIAGILRMFDALCAALDYAHRFTIHRDIKPENVMILENGSVKLMDFGISKLMSNPNITSASLVMGTPHYMAPEQLKNTSTVDARADIYSVGVMLYEVLTGDRPAGLAKPASNIRGEVPAALDPIIERCCQLDPAKRFQNAEELRAVLRAVRVAVEKKTDPSSAKTRAGYAGKSKTEYRPAARILVGAVLLVAVAGGAFAGLRWAELRRGKLVEASPMGLPRVPEAGERSTSPAAEFRGLSAEIPTLQRRAEQAAAKYSQAQRETLIDPILALGGTLWAASGEAAATEPARALELGWDAAACYLAPGLWPEGMVFVPPSPPDAVPRHRGFFIDARPVTAAEFAQFRQSATWRLPPGADPRVDDAPMSGVALFDALAFLASARPAKRLPTAGDFDAAVDAIDSEEQRVFALGQEPALDSGPADTEAAEDENANAASPEAAAEKHAIPWLLFPGEDYEGWGEWTATSAEGNVEVLEATFGDVFLTWGGHWSEGGEFIVGDPAATNYETGHPSLGFRGVLDLPRDGAGLARIR